MNNKDKREFFAVLLVLFCCLSLTVYLHIQIPILENNLKLKQENKVTIDRFINLHQSNEILNTRALATLDKEETEIDPDIKYSYRTEEGFKMISYSDAWTTDKLKDLYDELKLNKHGEEFELLSKVIVYAQPDSYAAGDQQTLLESLHIVIDFPAFPKGSGITFYRSSGKIQLFNGDKYTEVSQMADVLSHEYGHHYTFYYFFKNNKLHGTDYEKIRNVEVGKVMYDWHKDYTYYQNNHQWYLIEMAAEDYVQLMGSPMTKNIVKYIDVNQSLHGAKVNYQWHSYNGTIQENILIPFADEVPGLAEYYNQFISDEPITKTTYERKSFDLQITKGTSHHDAMSGSLDFTNYKISWDDIYKNDGAIYTLVCCDENGGNLFPIKTVYANQAMNAYIGTVSYESANKVYWSYDTFAQGTKNFFVTVVLPDGTIYKSNILTYKF